MLMTLLPDLKPPYAIFPFPMHAIVFFVSFSLHFAPVN